MHVNYKLIAQGAWYPSVYSQLRPTLCYWVHLPPLLPFRSWPHTGIFLQRSIVGVWIGNLSVSSTLWPPPLTQFLFTFQFISKEKSQHPSPPLLIIVRNVGRLGHRRTYSLRRALQSLSLWKSGTWCQIHTQPYLPRTVLFTLSFISSYLGAPGHISKQVLGSLF